MVLNKEFLYCIMIIVGALLLSREPANDTAMARRRMNGKQAVLAACPAPRLAAAPTMKRPAKQQRCKRWTQLQLAVRQKVAPNARRPFQIFMAEKAGFAEGASQQLRMRTAAKLWKAIPDDQKQKFKVGCKTTRFDSYSDQSSTLFKEASNFVKNKTQCKSMLNHFGSNFLKPCNIIV